jgi:hypothetical protein
MLGDLQTTYVKINNDGTQEMNESFRPIDFLRDSVSKLALRQEEADVLFLWRSFLALSSYLLHCGQEWASRSTKIAKS